MGSSGTDWQVCLVYKVFKPIFMMHVTNEFLIRLSFLMIRLLL